MKNALILLLAFASITAQASTDVYSCQSKKGTIIFMEHQDNSLSLDVTNHEVILEDNAILTLASAVKDVATFYDDYVLNISKKTVRKKAGIDFTNNFYKAGIESRNTQGLQTCNLEVALNKYRQTLKVTYNCSILFKKLVKHEDQLHCDFQSLDDE